MSVSVSLIVTAVESQRFDISNLEQHNDGGSRDQNTSNT